VTALLDVLSDEQDSDEQDGLFEASLGADLRKIEAKIRTDDRSGIESRWEFGRRLVRYRGDNKQLPKGLGVAICAEFGISYAELAHRMRFAERYSTREQVSKALETCATWSAVIKDALYEKRPKGQPSADLDTELATDLLARESESETSGEPGHTPVASDPHAAVFAALGLLADEDRRPNADLFVAKATDTAALRRQALSARRWIERVEEQATTRMMGGRL
jgi:hypothetical protein